MSKFILILCCLILAGTACKTAYVPNSVNVPLFDGEGQMRLSGDLNGNIQFAASPGRRFGVMANAMFRQDGESTDAVYGKGSFFEVGFGGFNNSAGPLRWETYIGAGLGRTKTTDNGKTFEANGARFFFQPSIGVHHDIFEVAFTPRLVAGKFKSPKTTYTTQELIDNKLADIDDPVWIFAEPAFTGRISYKWIKLQIQIGKSFKLNDKPLAYESSMNSVGILFDFGNR